MLIVNLHGDYFTQLWEGAAHAAEEKDVNLFILPGEAPFSPSGYDYQANFLYDMVLPKNMDALILNSTSFCNYITEDQYRVFWERYSSIPLISIGLSDDGLYSVTVDNKEGIKSAVSHLIKSHKSKKIAFIRGPEKNPESQLRFEAFEEEMKMQGLAIDPALVVSGNFLENSGEEAVVTLLEKRKCSFDAIIASNDNMAVGAMKELSKRNIRIPEDVALIGFDNLVGSEYMVPALTTIRQPLYEQGKKALEIAVDILERGETPKEIVLPTELVIRNSCGCISKTELNYSMVENASERDPENPGLKQINEFLKEIEVLFLQAKNLDDTFNNLFLKKISHFLEKHFTAEKNSNYWINAILTVQEKVKNNFQKKQDETKIELLFEKARSLAIEITQTKKLIQQEERRSKSVLLREVERNILARAESDQFLEVVRNHLPYFSIKSCYIASYPESIQHAKNSEWKGNENADLVFVYEEKPSRMAILKSGGILIESLLSKDFFPQDRRRTMLASPLYFKEEQLGLILFELGIKDGTVYETLASLISNAMKVSRLLKQQEKQQEELRKSEERFREMALFLPTIIIETDADLRITFLNQAGLEIFALTKDSLNKPLLLLNLVDEKDRERLLQYCFKLLNEKLIEFAEFRIVNQKGERISLLSRATPIERGGQIAGIRWSSIDIKPFMGSLLLPGESFFREYNFNEREKEILLLLLQGYKNKEISEKLFLAESTVKGYIGNIYSELGVNNKNEFFDIIREYQTTRLGYDSFIYSLVSKLICN
jgi:PAS domain S-box-containing protein